MKPGARWSSCLCPWRQLTALPGAASAFLAAACLCLACRSTKHIAQTTPALVLLFWVVSVFPLPGMSICVADLFGVWLVTNICYDYIRLGPFSPNRQ